MPGRFRPGHSPPYPPNRSAPLQPWVQHPSPLRDRTSFFLPTAHPGQSCARRRYQCLWATCIWAQGLRRALRWGRGAGAAAKGRPRRSSPWYRGCAYGRQHLWTEGGGPGPSTPDSGGGAQPVSQEPGKQTAAFRALGAGAGAAVPGWSFEALSLPPTSKMSSVRVRARPSLDSTLREENFPGFWGAGIF